MRFMLPLLVMNGAFPSASVDGYEDLIRSVDLPDPDDRHVLAAARHAKASLIVTFNLRDFPASVLAPFGVVAAHPDDFVLDRIAADMEALQQVIAVQAGDLQLPRGTVPDLLTRLQECGLPRSVARLRAGMLP